MSEQHEVVIVGGGQAGLTMSYHLRQRGIEHLVLERSERVADAWIRRYDSLSMLTPNWMNQLPGLPYPGAPNDFSPKATTIAYLQAFAASFSPPIRFGVEVTAIHHENDGFVVTTSDGKTLVARQVVIATGPFQKPRVPALRLQLSPSVTQLHSSTYVNPEQLGAGDVLVVGSGNSGIPIADEIARTGRFRVYLSVGDNRKRPRRMPGSVAREMLLKLGMTGVTLAPGEAEREEDIMWWFQHLGLYDQSIDTPAGHALSSTLSDAYIGGDLRETTTRSGAQLVERVVDVAGQSVSLEGGHKLEVATVIWATGFELDFGYIKAPAFDAAGAPVHRRGVSTVPGLYFLGLRFLHTMGSSLLFGVGRDAAHLAEQISARSS